jgi:hypothetical protein
LNKQERKSRHHGFQHENGVWGRDSKDDEGRDMLLKRHIEIRVNRKGIRMAIGNWAYRWAQIPKNYHWSGA